MGLDPLRRGPGLGAEALVILFAAIAATDAGHRVLGIGDSQLAAYQDARRTSDVRNVYFEPITIEQAKWIANGEAAWPMRDA